MFVNLLNSRVVTKSAVFGILLSISLSLVFKATLPAKLVMTGILFSTSAGFCSKIINILFSVSVAFPLRAAVQSNSVKLGILFSISVIF